MINQEKIEDLRDKVSKNYITNIDELMEYEPEIDMLASIPESGELLKIKETIRKVVEHDDR